MTTRPSGARRTPDREPGRAGAVTAALRPTRRSIRQIRARIASGFYDRDDVRDQVLRRISAQVARLRAGPRRG